ncbi:hypothetical protein P691DRAFT_807145 [Macrolepiota fuliginosa MF-IS2]|uniref:Uncharacterized protein n=1 Tax=Macrolepiota fuliginosa MF-IS2 TaxID=1400762 RepID=A0A9P5X6I4_9AGAR|nr:hypothetical protein P691DRAFT_807145 [Macrolepiota fuliginosa MF-IS2]
MMNCYQTTVSDIVELAPLFERRSMTIEVEDFGRHITDLHHVFNQLRTAKDIIEDAHQTLLLTRIHELSQRIVEQLGKIRDVFIRWHAYCTSGSADKFYFIPEILDMTRHIASFAWSVQPLYAQIKQIIRDGYHRKKAKKAQEKRKKELKNGISEVRGFRSLVSEAEALEVLERVDGILQGIAHFSTEFGAALLYFDGGRNGAAGQTSRDALQPCPRYPRNPFWVPDIITERVMNQLRFELGVLSQLPGAKN